MMAFLLFYAWVNGLYILTKNGAQLGYCGSRPWRVC